MPALLIDALAVPQPFEPPRKRWTRPECRALEQAGLLSDDRALELIQGDLIDKPGKKRPHSNGVLSLMRVLVGIFGWDYVQQEVPIDVAPDDNPINEPEPDLIVLTRPAADFPVLNPEPTDLRLVVEVADTTLRFDLSVKSSLYARAGIGEYWVLDLNGRRLIVHREPRQGKYTSVSAYGGDESIVPLAAPQSRCLIADLLPPQ